MLASCDWHSRCGTHTNLPQLRAISALFQEFSHDGVKPWRGGWFRVKERMLVPRDPGLRANDSAGSLPPSASATPCRRKFRGILYSERFTSSAHRIIFSGAVGVLFVIWLGICCTDSKLPPHAAVPPDSADRTPSPRHHQRSAEQHNALRNQLQHHGSSTRLRSLAQAPRVPSSQVVWRGRPLKMAPQFTFRVTRSATARLPAAAPEP